MLSGGNQQKIVIGRWLFAGAELFILDEPTQGIDIAARIAVYRLINHLTAAGKAVILISSDHDELLAMSRPRRHHEPRAHGRRCAMRQACPKPIWSRPRRMQQAARHEQLRP